MKNNHELEKMAFSIAFYGTIGAFAANVLIMTTRSIIKHVIEVKDDKTDISDKDESENKDDSEGEQLEL